MIVNKIIFLYYIMSIITKEPEIIKEEELIFYKKGNKIMSCGLDINSQYLKSNMGVGLKCSDVDKKDKTKVEKLFENLMVPSGLIYMKYKQSTTDHSESKMKKMKMIENDNVIDDEIYDKIYKLVDADKSSYPALEDSYKKEEQEEEEQEEEEQEEEEKEKLEKLEKLIEEKVEELELEKEQELEQEKIVNYPVIERQIFVEMELPLKRHKFTIKRGGKMKQKQQKTRKMKKNKTKKQKKAN